MYKRELCKNWTEAGFCRYGNKCQYAHGVDELSENHHLYLSEQKQGNANDKYKSQNCRQFYRERFCPYGKRCHFRHEYRTFKKVHRHFYMAHLAALTLTQYDMLADAERAPDGYCEEFVGSCELSFEAAKECSSNLSTDGGADCSESSSSTAESDSVLSIIPTGSRLPIFQSIVAIDDADEGSIKPLKLMSETQSSGCVSEAQTEASSSALLKLMSGIESADLLCEEEENWSSGGLLEDMVSEQPVSLME